jgi:transposase
MAQAILLVNQKQPTETIKLLTGLGRSRAFWLRREYLAKGKKVLDVKPRGINKLLTKRQLAEIVKTVKTKKPKDLEFYGGYEFWNTGVLANYIDQKYHIRYKSKTSYYLIFKRVNFTYHKPGRVYQKYDPLKVRRWRKEITPKIKQAWKETNTAILCEDEMKLSTQTTFQKIWLPQGEYPEVKVSNKKESRSVYGFLNIKTGEQHAFKTAWQNMYITRDQLVKIRRIYPNQQILLLWDGPGTHRGREVTNYVKADGKIEIIYFPPYSPQENPQEHVWREGRKEVSHNKFIENIDTATDDFVKFLNNRKFPYKLLKFKSTFGM